MAIRDLWTTGRRVLQASFEQGTGQAIECSKSETAAVEVLQKRKKEAWKAGEEKTVGDAIAALTGVVRGIRQHVSEDGITQPRTIELAEQQYDAMYSHSFIPIEIDLVPEDEGGMGISVKFRNALFGSGVRVKFKDTGDDVQVTACMEDATPLCTPLPVEENAENENFPFSIEAMNIIYRALISSNFTKAVDVQLEESFLGLAGQDVKSCTIQVREFDAPVTQDMINKQIGRQIGSLIDT